MTPLENVLLSALELGKNAGVSPEDTVSFLVSRIPEKQNRYKWRKKISSLLSTPSDSPERCPFTGDFLEDLNL